MGRLSLYLCLVLPHSNQQEESARMCLNLVDTYGEQCHDVHVPPCKREEVVWYRYLCKTYVSPQLQLALHASPLQISAKLKFYPPLLKLPCKTQRSQNYNSYPRVISSSNSPVDKYLTSTHCNYTQKKQKSSPKGDRTLDLKINSLALYQLSYQRKSLRQWQDSNLRAQRAMD